jgi:hypothetical protein
MAVKSQPNSQELYAAHALVASSYHTHGSFSASYGLHPLPPGQDKEAAAISSLGDPTLIIINKLLAYPTLPPSLLLDSSHIYSYSFRSASNFNPLAQLTKFVSCTRVPLWMGPHSPKQNLLEIASP